MNTDLIPTLLSTITSITEIAIVQDVITLAIVFVLLYAVLYLIPLSIVKISKYMFN